MPLPPQMGGVSATQMRAALRSGKLGSFKRGLPVELNDSDINDIIAILKEAAELRGVKDFIAEEDKIVNEVVDYLLGITVG